MFWVFLAAIGALVLLVVGISNGKDATWWAAWGQWAGAFGSVAAAGTAVWIAVVGWRKSDAQYREQAQRTETAELQYLASRFGVWIDRGNVVNPKVMVANSGPLPIYQVLLGFTFPDPGQLTAAWESGEGVKKSVIRIDSVGPTDGPQVHTYATKWLIRHLVDVAEEHLGEAAFTIPDEPGARRALSLAARTDLENIVPFGWVEVYFSDSNGNRWTRTREGKLMPNSEWS